MTSEKILIIEDDPSMLKGLKDNFEYVGYSVETASTGIEGLTKSLSSKPDLILLDLMLPEMNGYEICQSIRDNGLEMPIIMLTAKNRESDIILGLNLGADDYVVKPFSIRELLARVNSFLRRGRQFEQMTYSFGSFNLEIESRKLKENGKEIELTPKEFGLLSLFLKHSGRALTRDQILDLVWGHDILVTTRSVDRCINGLRNKIEKNPRKPKFIKTVRELGYRFEISNQN